MLFYFLSRIAVLHTYMRPVVTDQGVCSVSCEPFGLWTRWAVEPCIRWGPDPHGKGQF